MLFVCLHLMKTFVQSSTSGSWSKPPLELTALQPAAHPGEQHPLPDGTICKGEARLPLTPERVGHYADPLAPLKERDLLSLTTLFQRDDMYDIEVDLNQMLLRLLPEPCWEEDPFEFLRDFL